MTPVALCDLVRFLPPEASLWRQQAAAVALDTAVDEPPAPVRRSASVAEMAAMWGG